MHPRRTTEDENCRPWSQVFYFQQGLPALFIAAQELVLMGLPMQTYHEDQQGRERGSLFLDEVAC
jgi:hypothetical protein